MTGILGESVTLCEAATQLLPSYSHELRGSHRRLNPEHTLYYCDKQTYAHSFQFTVMTYSSVYTNVSGAMVDMMSGFDFIVACFIFASRGMTTRPLRWIIQKMGGFSFSRVPRPRVPLKGSFRPLCPLRPFFHGFRDHYGMGLCTLHHTPLRW